MLSNVLPGPRNGLNTSSKFELFKFELKADERSKYFCDFLAVLQALQI